jgi:hypothetical protein
MLLGRRREPLDFELSPGARLDALFGESEDVDGAFTAPAVAPGGSDSSDAAALVLFQQSMQPDQQSPSSSSAEDPPRHATIDITPYLAMPQVKAAEILGMPASTLSKRWKEAVGGDRKWPFRIVRKIDKQIMTLLLNVPSEADAPPITPELEASLAAMVAKRDAALAPVAIRLVATAHKRQEGLKALPAPPTASATATATATTTATATATPPLQPVQVEVVPEVVDEK